ncbi:lysis system i-spanin subunit Rz [Arenimonas sp.]|uniref:lysis system i-spanin subunit Rz n=1 Tax=Arenimonas sp. TaxID=1872635 RepID=UPI0039E35352
MISLFLSICKAIGKGIAAVPGWAWVALAIAGALLASHLWYGSTRYDAGAASRQQEIDALQTRFDDYVAADRAAAEAAKLAAQTAEQAQRDVFASLDAKHQKDLDDAKRKADAVVAGLRAGNLRLRNEWRGCQANAGRNLSETPASPGVADDATQLREASAGRIIRAGADADAQITGLQSALRTCTAAPNNGAPP